MIQPGLDRIGLLLKDVQFPWKAIHVAGTNGKGSICLYASHLLRRRLIRHGCFTSPHLVHRSDCITINSEPINHSHFKRVEDHFREVNEEQNINASEFELLTATAFQVFTDSKVDVGVVEVGMGGKLDATNILNNQVVSVISKIARDHENFLGSTLEEIAQHKAGILRRGVPYIINPINEFFVMQTIREYARTVGAGPEIRPDTPRLREDLFKTQNWKKLAVRLLPFERDNAVLSYLAFVETLKSMDLNTQKASNFLLSLRTKKNPGRLQTINLPETVFGFRQPILVDGAHNPDAANELDAYVNRHLRSNRGRGSNRERSGNITWVIAMTEGKNAREYLKSLLKPGDTVLTTSFEPVDGMPWVKPMDPLQLKKIALEVEPQALVGHVSQPEPFRALCAARYLAGKTEDIVLTGSLYLVGQFLRQKEKLVSDPHYLDMKTIDLQEKKRVTRMLGEDWAWRPLPKDDAGDSGGGTDLAVESQELLKEINQLSREMEALEIEEARLQRSQSSSPDALSAGDSDNQSAASHEKSDSWTDKTSATPRLLNPDVVRNDKNENNKNNNESPPPTSSPKSSPTKKQEKPFLRFTAPRTDKPRTPLIRKHIVEKR